MVSGTEEAWKEEICSQAADTTQAESPALGEE